MWLPTENIMSLCNVDSTSHWLVRQLGGTSTSKTELKKNRVAHVTRRTQINETKNPITASLGTIFLVFTRQTLFVHAIILKEKII